MRNHAEEIVNQSKSVIDFTREIMSNISEDSELYKSSLALIAHCEKSIAEFNGKEIFIMDEDGKYL